MIKLAIVRSHPSPLDINKYNVQEIGLAKGLLKNGISTEIYSCWKHINEEIILYKEKENYVKIIPLKGIHIKNIVFYPGLRKTISKKDYNILQVHEDSQLMTFWLLFNTRKKNILTVLYQGMYKNYSGFNNILQIIFDLLFKSNLKRNAKIVLAKTSSSKKYLKNKGYTNINVLPIGLNINENKEPFYDVNVNNFKKEHNKLLLYIGQIEKRRNPKFLINLLMNVRKNNSSNVGLIIVGDGPLLNNLIKYIRKLQLNEHILFIKSISNNKIFSIYNKCDLFLLPSNYDIYGMVVLESLYAGIPVISTKTAGSIDILNNLDFGCCLDLDINKWTSAVNYYLFNKPTNKSLLKEYIIENYNWNKIAKQYIKICGL